MSKKKTEHVDFNENDYNVDKVKKHSKLFNLKTKYNYRIYGLRNDGNPPILIKFNDNIVDVNQEAVELQNFFQKQNILLSIDNELDSDKKTIHIGLRHDLRSRVSLCSCSLSTIIYAIEKRLKLDEEFKVPGIPRLS